MRALAIIMMLAVTGVQGSAWAAADGHGESQPSAEAHADDGAHTDEHDDCDDDCGCDGPCSPVCDRCACSLGARSIVMQVPVLVVPVVLVSLEPPLIASPLAPRAPARDAVFHPPRA